MITTGFKRMALVLGLGTILARGPQRLCVHYDDPRLRTSPTRTTKTKNYDRIF